MRRIRKNSLYDVYYISRYLCQCYANNLFGVVSIAQLLEVKDCAALGGDVEVVSSNPTVGDKIFFNIYRIIDFYCSPYQSSL